MAIRLESGELLHLETVPMQPVLTSGVGQQRSPVPFIPIQPPRPLDPRFILSPKLDPMVQNRPWPSTAIAKYIHRWLFDPYAGYPTRDIIVQSPCDPRGKLLGSKKTENGDYGAVLAWSGYCWEYVGAILE